MGSEAQKLHIFFFPFLAYGHMIPLIDTARIFASRGVKSTIITTPLNASILAPAIHRDQQSNLEINIQVLQFPTAEAGLPKGCENVASIPSSELGLSFVKAFALLKKPFEDLVEEFHPDAIISDEQISWTTEVARKYGIPRIVFYANSFFALCVSEMIKRHAPQKKVESEYDKFVVPGLPDEVQMTKSQLDKYAVLDTKISDMLDSIERTNLQSFGILVNSCYEIEPKYADFYKKDMGRNAWQIGPVSLQNRNNVDKIQRGKKASVDEHFCLDWLNSKETDSVVYVSFGSLFSLCTDQLQEIALGLENSGVEFIFVVRISKDEEKVVFPDGYEERLNGKGLIIRDWAPQLLILDHPAVGGFMNHCGWNSTLESITASVPMITWPLSSDQFYNENLVTDFLKVGIRAGNAKWNPWGKVIEEVSVSKEKVEDVVRRLMGNGEEARGMRRRATEIGEMARRAVEDGGSSHKDLDDLLNELRVYRN